MPSPPRGYTEGESCPTCGKTLGKYARYSASYPYCSKECKKPLSASALARRQAEKVERMKRYHSITMGIKARNRVKRMTRRHSAPGRSRSRSARRNTASA